MHVFSGEWTTALSRKEKKLRGRKDESRQDYGSSAGSAGAGAAAAADAFPDDWPDTPPAAPPAADAPAPAPAESSAAAAPTQETQDTKKESAPMEQRLSKKERKKKVGSAFRSPFYPIYVNL